MVAARAEETAIGAGRTFYQAKHATCDYFFRYMLPRAQIDLCLVEMLDDSCLVTTPEQIRAA